VGKGSFDNPGKKLINTQLGAAWHTGQNSLVQTGTAGNIVKMAFLKLLQNTDTVGKFFNSRGREFHASGAVTRGNLRSWSVLAKGITKSSALRNKGPPTSKF
jgi:hypothetical protein